MRVLAILAAGVLAASIVPSALARSNVGGSCGSDTNDYVRVTIEAWWQRTVDLGFGGDVGLAVETLAPLLGVEPTEEAVSGAIMDGVDGAWDKNDNDFVCMKDPKDTPGTPSYIFVVKDDASSKD
jgi:hypothetical protein